MDYTEIYKTYEIIDAHAHIFPMKIAEKASQNIGNFYRLPPHHSGSSAELLENGRRFGVHGYLVSAVATSPHQVMPINDFIAKECGMHPEFRGLGALHPDFEHAGDEVVRLRTFGLCGIKLHPDFQKFNIDDPAAYEIYEAAGEDLPILFHMGDDRYDYSKPWRLAKVLDDFPRLRVIAAHLGGYKTWNESRDYLKNDRVRFDVSSTLPILGIEKSLEQIRYFGSDRCFFGIDYPLWNYTEEFERFFQLKLTPDELKRILAQNVKDFFGVTEW